MKGPGIAILLGMKKKKGEHESMENEEETEEENLSSNGKAEAAGEIMDAITNGDRAALASALTNFYDMCAMEPAPEDY
jgi:hypothetical protein